MVTTKDCGLVHIVSVTFASLFDNSIYHDANVKIEIWFTNGHSLRLNQYQHIMINEKLLSDHDKFILCNHFKHFI